MRNKVIGQLFGLCYCGHLCAVVFCCVLLILLTCSSHRFLPVLLIFHRKMKELWGSGCGEPVITSAELFSFKNLKTYAKLNDLYSSL